MVDVGLGDVWVGVMLVFEDLINFRYLMAVKWSIFVFLQIEANIPKLGIRESLILGINIFINKIGRMCNNCWMIISK
jgi:hypothetical protein